MNMLDLPLHPTMRHPLTGAPLRAIAARPKLAGRGWAKTEQAALDVAAYLWPGMGGDDTVPTAEEKAAADKKAADDKAAADKQAADEKAAADKKAAEEKKPERKAGVPANYAIDDQGNSLGYPVDTPLERMKTEEAAAYATHHMRVHEQRNKALLKITGGKYGKDLEADMKELAELRRAKMTDAERAIEDAKQEGKKEAVSTTSLQIAAQFFDVSLDHVDEDRRKVLLESIDLSKVVNSDGTIDTDKVRTISETLAPKSGKDTRDPNYGGGRRPSSAASGVAAGRSRYQEERDRREKRRKTADA